MAAIASGLIRQKRQAREQQVHRPTPHRRRRSPNKNKGLCNGNLVDIFSKVRIFGLKKRRYLSQNLNQVESKNRQVLKCSLLNLTYLDSDIQYS
uniref:Uncharacterized protein n=1 Tax=Hucho hucho TaxID=62062 RepID=A0A4W5LPF2_9TELE